MAKGASISVGSDVKEVESGLKRGVIEPLEDVAEILQDVAKDGDKAGEQLESAMRDAQKDTSRLSNEYEELNRKIRQAGKTGRNLGDDVKTGTDAAKRDLRELGDEAKQNAAETFSSFDGSFESLVDGIQGTLGGIVSNIGPVGAMAGAAAAVGLGLITAELQESAERAAEIREETSALTTEIVNAGGALDKVEMVDRVREWSNEIADNKEWWELWQDSATTNFQKVQDYADKTGASMKDLFNAISGQDTSGSLDLLEDLEKQLEQVSKDYDALARAKAGGTTRAGELKLEKEALEGATAAIRERLNIQDTAISEAREQLALTEEYAKKEEAAAAATRLREDAIGALQGELNHAIDAYDEFVDKETGAADPAKYIAAMQARMDATANFNTNVQQLAANTGLSFEETQAILERGVDFAPMLAAIMAGGPEMQAQYAGQIRAMLDGGQAILDGTETTATITTKTDAQDAERQLDATATKERTAEVGATANTKTAAAQLDATASKPRTATIVANADTGTARQQLDRLTEKLTVTVQARVVDQRGVPVP